MPAEMLAGPDLRSVRGQSHPAASSPTTAPTGGRRVIGLRRPAGGRVRGGRRFTRRRHLRPAALRRPAGGVPIPKPEPPTGTSVGALGCKADDLGEALAQPARRSPVVADHREPCTESPACPWRRSRQDAPPVVVGANQRQRSARPRRSPCLEPRPPASPCGRSGHDQPATPARLLEPLQETPRGPGGEDHVSR